ncbi:Trehalose-6-P synthase/phosphatase complex subunit [Neophaeococcomyces mojaviensis]|uniref:Trehalose-6-P synthase/phosphatase complex subunit n=1 Tax=Neophaeococcomyces mojaviensis TaxID=3383035 RepID=A0ACC3A8V8_9EURO|nr:Trehalose-6-P synthase/phosphatase complex subunit [Knufia sp. JES_112]
MAVIVVCLYLPYTCGFTSATTPSVQTTTPSSETDDPEPEALTTTSSRSSNGAHGRSQSLQLNPTFVQSTASLPILLPVLIPQTLGATSNTDSIFRPHSQAPPFSMALPDRGIVRNKSTTSLQTLSALDAQSSTWGNVSHLIQPKSMAVSPPSRKIEDVAKDKNTEEQSDETIVEMPVLRSRKTREMEYTTENYSILPTTLGNAGLYAAIHAIASQGYIQDKTWVGTLGMPTDALSPEVKDHIEGKLLTERDCLTVYVNDTDVNAHYENYCKVILWPTFHSQVPAKPESKAYEENIWLHYVAVNQAFADKIIDNWKQDDMIWIHDYHLLLVPGFVRKQIPNAKIGLFLHSAFPPSEIFKNLPSRYDLLEGMLGANLIAFQTKDFRHHFLQTCTRVLNIATEDNGLLLENGRYIDVATIPMGIDVESMNARRKLPEVQDRTQELSDRFKDKILIVARDKLDGIHGLKQKLKGFAEFLDRYPEWESKVVLIQIATSASPDDKLKLELHNLVEHINREFGGDINYQPIHYLTQDIDYSQYLALLSIADCMLVTSLCEGMNLTCHEFIVCQDGTAGGKGYAPLVISQFIGAADVFGGNVFHVNPWHPGGIADQLNEALKKSIVGNNNNWRQLYALTQRHSALAWYRTFISGLEKAWKEQWTRHSSNVPRLQIAKLREKYHGCKKRLIILDFEGTLTTWDSPKEKVITTPKRVIDILSDLMDDENNVIYVTSQRPRKDLDHMLRMVSNIGVVAESGAFIRKYGSTKWTATIDLDTTEWRNGILAMLGMANIPGAQVDEMESGLMFQYEDSGTQDISNGHAGNLASRVNEMCKDQNVEAHPFERGLCIHNKIIKKTLATKIIEQDLTLDNGKLSVDFILVVGDSEDLFRWSHSLEDLIEAESIVTCVVGKRHTDAATALASISTVLSALEKMLKVDAV